MPKKYGLSDKYITEEYEDLLFRKVMAKYAEKESARIEAEISAEAEKADGGKIKKLFGKKERRENAAILWKYGKKLITAAAMVALVGVISVSSVVYASAEAREAIAEYLYSLTYKDFGRYTEITNQWYADPRSHRYVITYIPRGFDFMGYSSIGGEGRSENYVKGDRYIYFLEDYSSNREMPDPAVYSYYEERTFGDTPGAVARTAERVEIYLFKEDAVLLVEGNLKDEMILIRVAESIVPNEAFAGDDEPAGTAAEIIDEEIYTWENAYGLTYIPENFVFHNADIRSGQTIIDYICGDQIISFLQAEDASGDANTENAEVVETIQIGESEALLVVRGETASINWFYKDMYFLIIGNVPADEIVKMAESVVPVPQKEAEIIDEEIYTWENAYGLTYLPEGAVFSNSAAFGSQHSVDYFCGDKYISFLQAGNAVFQVDTENACVESVQIRDSEGLLVFENGNTYLNWNVGSQSFQIYSTVETEEVIRMARSVVPVPEKEPEIIDAEIYDWEGAWAPTYMAAGYVFSELKEKSVAIYENGEKYVAFSQSSGSVFQLDTEDTDKTEMISVNGSEAIYVEKNGFVFIVWSIGDKNFSVRGTIEPEEAVKIAEGLIPVE
ncbi:MAG: DUF4367 domain-containing protein [Oscillospiraceae bacterium]|nr:DUF4367 domain-containing protein [Oscillospiraceae bacterium]